MWKHIQEARLTHEAVRLLEQARRLVSLGAGVHDTALIL